MALAVTSNSPSLSRWGHTIMFLDSINDAKPFRLWSEIHIYELKAFHFHFFRPEAKTDDSLSKIKPVGHKRKTSDWISIQHISFKHNLKRP